MKPDFSARVRRILVCGPSGSGKSTWQLMFLRSSPGRVWAFDQKGEFSERGGLPRASTLAGLQRAAGRSVAFYPHHCFPGQTGHAFRCYTAAVFAWSQRFDGPKWFFADELQDFVAPTPTGIPRGLSSILESGRAWQLNSVCCAQAGNLVGPRLRGQFSEVVAFRHSESRALETLGCFGLEPDKVRGLGRGEFLHRDIEGGGERRGRIYWMRGVPHVE